jgi:hypothetical protein
VLSSRRIQSNAKKQVKACQNHDKKAEIQNIIPVLAAEPKERGMMLWALRSAATHCLQYWLSVTSGRLEVAIKFTLLLSLRRSTNATDPSFSSLSTTATSYINRNGGQIMQCSHE